MNRNILLVLITGGMFLAGNVGAKEISLEMRETYRQGNLTVTCGQPLTVDKPLALNNCQHWDDFNNKCMFEKTTYTYKNIECVEECQHWDKFSSTCYYQTNCSFFPPQKLFVQTTCDKFDDFNNTCLKKSDMKIEPNYR
ncbi:MAG: hypothetical protein QMA97_02310 [Glaciecola sp.]|jgi:hypothetical protein